MAEQEEIKPMSSELHPIGTLMFEDFTHPSSDAAWEPHRAIWEVIAHRECQEVPGAPVRLACEVRLVRQEVLNDN